MFHHMHETVRHPFKDNSPSRVASGIQDKTKQLGRQVIVLRINRILGNAFVFVSGNLGALPSFDGSCMAISIMQGGAGTHLDGRHSSGDS